MENIMGKKKTIQIDHHDELLIHLLEDLELRRAAWKAMKPLLEKMDLPEDIREAVEGSKEWDH